VLLENVRLLSSRRYAASLTHKTYYLVSFDDKKILCGSKKFEFQLRHHIAKPFRTQRSRHLERSLQTGQNQGGFVCRFSIKTEDSRFPSFCQRISKPSK
jgi:hypothetical protein